ncbi:YbjN domain-containing protein [Nocardioides sp.]|uniref:YbjN domain-containing protein n=1 Tax=Nocardioides sp. TaxID=35761 RepID=UPI0035653E2B
MAQTVRAYLRANEIEFDETGPGLFSFALPGEKKLQTAVRLDVGRHAVGIHAFVCRRPDENHERVYRWLLQRNLKLYAVAFALDPLGDIYLDARLPFAVVEPEELDRLLGAVLSAADESFNTLLELGFSTAIRKEWEWRNERGEPTTNLEAFRGWLESDSGSPSESDSGGQSDSGEGSSGR